MMEKGTFISKAPCPQCGSADNLLIYSKGPATCMTPSCGAKFNPDTLGLIKPKNVSEHPLPSGSLDRIRGYKSLPIPNRGIPKEVTEHYGVKVQVVDGAHNAHYYPYGDEGYKIRKLPKDFSVVGKLKGLFGQSSFRGGGRKLVITEGELDALAVAAANHTYYKGKIYPVVSLPSASGTKTLLEEREWVRSFEEVVLLFDNDEAGREAEKKACEIIGVDKVRIGELTAKDPSDELRTKGYMSILQAVWDAKRWVPDSILTGDDLWGMYKEELSKETVPYPDCFRGLNDKVKGMRFNEIDLFTAGTNVGKSTLFREIILHLFNTTEYKVGAVFLEETPGETTKKLMSMEARIDMENHTLVEEKEVEVFDKLFRSERIVVLDHKGNVSDEGLVNRIEELCLYGCKFIFLDHITIAASDPGSNNANTYIDKMLNGILRITQKHEVWIGVISHLRKTGGSSSKKAGEESKAVTFEEGAMPSLDDIKGSGSLKQIPYQIITATRHISDESMKNRHITRFSVLKARRGSLGSAGLAEYNRDTGRLSYKDNTAPVSKPSNSKRSPTSLDSVFV